MSSAQFVGRLAVAGAIIVLLSTIINEWHDGGFGKLWNDATAPTSAIIESPNQEAVPHTVPVFGTYDNLPDGSLIWAVPQDAATNRLYPAESACWTDETRFSCGTLTIGADHSTGETMKILIVSATAEAANAFNRYQLDKGGPYGPNPGLGDLPQGTTILTSKTVVRSDK